MAQASPKQSNLERLIERWLPDPHAFACEAFLWGEGDLKQHTGPDEWQAAILNQVRDGLSLGEALRISVASGHGPGKSALVAWLILWAMLRPDTRGIVTANTATQLETKTWPELTKWYRLCAIGSIWRLTATALVSIDETRAKTWRIDAIPWSETRTEAFAGLHNSGKRIIVVYDEASAIPDVIWEVTEGAMTDQNTQIIWLAFGNPTRNTGRFRECFGRFRHRWLTHQVDSRMAKMTNKAEIAKWINDYGEDSDFIRVRVKGVFPRAGSTQLISADIIEAAKHRDPHTTIYDPLILAVDVARFGDDMSVILARRGRDARFRLDKYRGMDTMQLAARVALVIEEMRPDAVFIDETGVGGGVVDRLRQLRHGVIGVNFGSSPDGPVDGEKVSNKRAEMWVRMRNWLKTGGAIPGDVDMTNDLGAVEFGYNADNEIQLEKKDDMKKRGLASPDAGDALAISFAYPVASRNTQLSRTTARQVVSVDPDPYREL